jgi:hypothetical protein
VRAVMSLPTRLRTHSNPCLLAIGVGRAQQVTLIPVSDNLIVEQRCVPPECAGQLATSVTVPVR